MAIKKKLFILRHFLIEIIVTFKNIGFYEGLLVTKYRLLRSLYLNRNLKISKKYNRYNHITKNLRSKGFSSLKNIEKSQVKELLNQYKLKFKENYDRNFNEFIKDMKIKNIARGGKCILEPRIELSNIVSQPYLIEAITELFGMKINSIAVRPSCDLLIAPEKIVEYKNKFLSNHTTHDDSLRFHRDLDGHRFLKLFVYLTDCFEENGNHFYIENSANKFNMNFFLDERLGLEEINKYFGENSIKIITGKSGTSFIEDTTGWHSGSIPQIGTRIMLQILFIDKLSSKISSKNRYSPGFIPLTKFINN